MELFTFIFEFNGGSYVRQVEASSWRDAPQAWADGFDGPEDWTEKDSAELARELEDSLAGPVALWDTVGTWCFSPEVRGEIWRATYVRTNPVGAERTVTVRRLKDQRSNDDLTDRTPAELIEMVWPLTESVWAFKEAAERSEREVSHAQSRLPRHLVRFRKRGR